MFKIDCEFQELQQLHHFLPLGFAAIVRIHRDAVYTLCPRIQNPS